jgi:hypothetical protein
MPLSQRAAISEARRRHDAEFGHCGGWHLGVSRPEETRSRISKGVRRALLEGRSSLRGMLGRHHTEETKRKMSEAQNRAYVEGRGGWQYVLPGLVWKRRSHSEESKRLIREKLLAPDGVCALCGRFRKMNRDHDHKTGKERGLLCHGCNRSLGILESWTRRIGKDKIRAYLARGKD